VKTCPYCGSDVEKMAKQHYYCGFCCMSLNVRIIKENRERLDVHFREYVLDAQINKTTPEIMIYHIRPLEKTEFR
jgi:hypothetical protein